MSPIFATSVSRPRYNVNLSQRRRDVRIWVGLRWSARRRVDIKTARARTRTRQTGTPVVKKKAVGHKKKRREDHLLEGRLGVVAMTKGSPGPKKVRDVSGSGTYPRRAGLAA